MEAGNLKTYYHEDRRTRTGESEGSRYKRVENDSSFDGNQELTLG